MKRSWKRGRKIMLIIGVILGGLLSINLIGFILNVTLFKGELNAIEPYGQMVDVGGSKMHIYAMGSGEKTIVLLPGWGVALPSADFGPLMRRLSEEHTVVTVEYFGVGFSDEVDTPRINENYTNEIRAALDQAGFKPPYILMPHSASGIYSEYYAKNYPDEVSAIVMLDTTSTAEIKEMPKLAMNAVYTLAKFQQATGMTRLNSRLILRTKSMENGYTEKEREDYKLFNNHALNNTIINQALLFMDNIKEVNEVPFPENIPVLKIIAQQTVDREGMAYQEAHLSKLGSNVFYKVVDATHMLYETKVDEIAELTNGFLDDAANHYDGSDIFK